MSIQVDHVTKRFGAFTVLNDVNLHVQSGELVALLGPSGCGKTTLLRILAGLERPDQGRIVLHGTEVTNQRITERQVGFVFQHYALFRHMTVADNVAFGLTVKPRAQRPRHRGFRRKSVNCSRLSSCRPWLIDIESAVRRTATTCCLGSCIGRGTKTVAIG